MKFPFRMACFQGYVRLGRVLYWSRRDRISWPRNHNKSIPDVSAEDTKLFWFWTPYVKQRCIIRTYTCAQVNVKILTHACCSPVFLRETSVMKYKNLQYKYPLQQESFECLSNAVQLRICTINISQWKYMGVSKNCGVSPKMDGENNGKPYFNGWFGGKTHYFRKHPFLQSYSTHSFSPESFHESFHVVKQVKAHKAKALNLDKCYVWGFFESLEGLTKIPGNERWMSLWRGLKFKHHPDFFGLKVMVMGPQLMTTVTFGDVLKFKSCHKKKNTQIS